MKLLPFSVLLVKPLFLVQYIFWHFMKQSSFFKWLKAAKCFGKWLKDCLLKRDVTVPSRLMSSWLQHQLLRWCHFFSPTSSHRYKLAFSQSRIASYLFDGTGYALINNMERRGKFGVVTRFDIAVRTVANNGTLLLMVNGVRGKKTALGTLKPSLGFYSKFHWPHCWATPEWNSENKHVLFLQDKYFLLELRHGFLRLTYDFGFSGGPKIFESDLPKLQINDARYHEVYFFFFLIDIFKFNYLPSAGGVFTTAAAAAAYRCRSSTTSRRRSSFWWTRAT